MDKARQLVSTPMPPRDWSWIASAVIRLLAALQLDEQDTIAALREELRPFAGQLVVSGAVTQVYGAYDGLIGEADLALGDREAARRHLASAVRLLERNGAGYWLVRARQALANCS